MSLQVLDPLPSPRCKPLLSPSNGSEFRFSSTDSTSGSVEGPPPVPSETKASRQETTYFPIAVSLPTSTADSAANPTSSFSRRVRFRPPRTVISTTSEKNEREVKVSWNFSLITTI